MIKLFLAACLFVCATSAGAAADRLSVLLDWFINPNHAPLIIAQERGYFEEVGLDVELIAPADPSAPPRLVAAGEADIAISYQPSLYLSVSEGLPIRRFGTLIATPLNSLVALADGPVQSIADLKGKTVGFSVGGFEDALLRKMLESEGLSLDDVTLVNVNFALTPALVSGNVDALIGAFRNFEMTQLRLEDSAGKAFFPEENGVPAYDELIYVAHTDTLDDDRLVRFLEATEKAALYLTNHPDEALEQFFQAHPDLKDELNRSAWFDTLPRFSKSPAALDPARYARFAQFMLDQGLIAEALPVGDYAVSLQ